jgi:hypothetical protein
MTRLIRVARVRFVVLRLDEIWSQGVPTAARETESATALPQHEGQAPTGPEARRVA